MSNQGGLAGARPTFQHHDAVIGMTGQNGRMASWASRLLIVGQLRQIGPFGRDLGQGASSMAATINRGVDRSTIAVYSKARLAAG